MPERARRTAWALGAGLGTAAFLGGPGGLVTGGVLAAGLHRWLPRARSPAERRAAMEEERLARQLPLTAELLAACLGSAPSPVAAVAAVGASVDAPMGPLLLVTAAELALGAPPELCWHRLGEAHPSLAPLARCLVRTSLTGAPAAAALTGLASGQRAEAVRAAHARVRRAGVLATAPLGLCFLPAFVLVGVAPVVVGLTTAFSRAM
ncbi:type II secretion system F family protein [Kitasatospora sp. NPDC056327]|uniref:type II secretion system F family protein n=1 Tax=Kitasatospora sp. NPDC056327 TaxID=3345785 RepID=UPI0035D5A7CB